MTTRMTVKPRPVLHSVTALALLAAAACFTLELRRTEAGNAPTAPTLTENALAAPLAANGAADREPLDRSWQRLRNPDRSVLRGADGELLATFTDGARTATLTGPSRTFTEPEHTGARIVTTDWVRLLPRAWERGAERQRWFTDWLRRQLGSTEDDLFATAFQYTAGAPVRKDRNGVPYAGDASFGPLPKGSRDASDRLKQSDFPDYLGVPHTFPDGTTVRPDPRRHRSLDCSGYLRAVLGHRGGYPLAPNDEAGGGLPRTADAMARSGLGTEVVPRSGGSAEGTGRPASLDTLHPGDLVFFELKRNGGRLDHAGLYLGRDTDGHQVFISSRSEADGPTVGDTGGASRLDGEGYYAQAFRTARRL
ncbi:C40 family peptidase [Streptomyces sp. XM4193]|uniref:C40 family peptidase n=1 Tax=Streptomyces sp. XM4193 TaxID=2929782 RepID=UPI001FF94BF3|nr:NlpC/P60 family protein [Streptomyces sp. XM4193]MCK1795552.1 C40 family peptidase [Streptomyces sp. XM4193]